MIYLIVNRKEKFCKIGYSNNPEARLMQIQTGNPYPLELVKVIEGDISKEKEIHLKFKHLALQGEWFNYTKEIKDYFKVNNEHGRLFIENLDMLYDCQGSEISIFLTCLGLLQYETNLITMDRKLIAKNSGTTLNTTNTAISKLVKKQIILKEGNNYYINPKLFYYG